MSKRTTLQDKKNTPPKSIIVSMVFILGTIAALLILFPPWESNEERKDRVTNRIMAKVKATEVKKVKIISRTYEFGMTTLSIKVATDDATALEQMLGKKLPKIIDFIDTLDYRNKKGEIKAVNKNSGQTAVKVDDTVFALIEMLADFAKKSDGHYDPVMRAYTKQWSLSLSRPIIPTKEDLEKARKLVGVENLVLNKEKKTVALKNKGMGFDLDTVINAVILKQLKGILDEAGYKDYFVFCGSDAILSGKMLKEDWRMSLQHPRDALLKYGSLTPNISAVMNANDYAPGIVKKRVRYHAHISIENGMPVKNFMTISVAGEDPLLAKLIALASFTMKRDEIRKFVARFPGYEVVYMDIYKKTDFSEGLKDRVIIKEKTNL